MLDKKFGIIKNKFSSSLLNEWQEIYKKNTITKTLRGDDCWGIDKNCLAYNWFLKKVMPQLSESFPKNTKLIFSSYINLHSIFPIHDDIKPLPEGAEGKHYLSILIPYSIDHKKENYDKVSTCFYDNDKKLIDRISWEENSLIWWESDLLHASSDFKTQGIDSKQYFITHTYV